MPAPLRLALLVFMLALAAPGALPQQARTPGRLLPTHPDLVYATLGGRSLRLDLYLPPATSKPAPLLVNIHGGGWTEGNKKGVPSYCVRMLQLGFAVASVDYRLTSQAGQWGKEPVIFPAQIQDIKGAVRWLRANAAKYNLDPDRFAAWGTSAGGHLVALMATAGQVPALEGTVGGNLEQSSRLQAAVDYFGPTDLLHVEDDVTTESMQLPLWRLRGSFLVGQLVGYNPQPGQDPDFKAHLNDPAIRKRLLLASPTTFVTSASTPLFIGHGARDPLVPVGQSRRLEAALRRAGVRTQLAITPEAGHGGLNPQTHLTAARFLCEILKPDALTKVATLKVAPSSRSRPGLMQQLRRILQ